MTSGSHGWPARIAPVWRENGSVVTALPNGKQFSGSRRSSCWVAVRPGMPKRWLANTLPAPATWLITPSKTRRSFNDFVGAGEDRWRHGEAERPGGLEIDDQLECRRLLDRQIGGVSPPLCRFLHNCR